ncbi:MAG: hypothetical protein R1F54_07845 [Candidatus Zeuxoniibacter abyssi]|nr:MAG: hypothetical protein R1F54_07845 [Candidatus Persebacteraceae bacterium AB1(2)]
MISASLSVFLVGCGSPNYSPSEMHLTYEEVKSEKPVAVESIPSLVKTSPALPALGNLEEAETYDVVVTKVPVRDLLFALARDSGVNMDVDARVGGVITMSALDQTLAAILERIKQQVNIRVDKVGEALVIKPDEPYYKKYYIDFISLNRTFSSSAASAGVGDVGTSSVNSTADNDFWAGLESTIQTILDGDAVGGGAGVTAGSNDPNLLQVEQSESKFSSRSNFDLNRNSGILLVYAPERLQQEVQSYVDDALSISKRQVLLEATIVEVVLNNQYKQGVDWSLFNSLAKTGLGLYQGAISGGPAAALQFLTSTFTETFDPVSFIDSNKDGQITELDGAVTFEAYNNHLASITSVGPLDRVVSYDRTYNRVVGDSTTTVTGTVAVTVPGIEYDRDRRDREIERLNEQATARSSGGLTPTVPSGDSFFTGAFRNGDISAAVQLLDVFGDSRVLSSPRISALNNQAAILRVVDQEVYFNIEVNDTVNEETGQLTGREYTIEENIVDVGFVMNVLPQISASDEIILNLKPAVTRVLEYRSAPVPAALGGLSGSVQNFVPITRVRELDSIISLRDGEVAVLGGLLEDRTGDNNRSVPGLSKLPGIGALFENIDQRTYKTEFIVFIKASVIKNPSLNGDYSDYLKLLPDLDFIQRDRENTYLPPKQKKTR